MPVIIITYQRTTNNIISISIVIIVISFMSAIKLNTIKLTISATKIITDKTNVKNTTFKVNNCFVDAPNKYLKLNEFLVIFKINSKANIYTTKETTNRPFERVSIPLKIGSYISDRRVTSLLYE